MKFEEFKDLFIQSLEIAADNAERLLGKSIPRTYEVLLHGAGCSGDIIDVDKAAIMLFIDEDSSYFVVDVAVQQVSPSISRIFVRASGHPPVPFAKTWDTPTGSGPFKQLIAQIQEVAI